MGNSGLHKLNGAGWLMAGIVALAMTSVRSAPVIAQTVEPSHQIDLGIIVVSTMNEAQAVMKQLQSGDDFSVLAREKSTDATSIDGGYLGKMDQEELRPELRNALRGRHAGELTNIVQLPSGFAILKIFSASPPATDLNSKRISSLVATGAIRIGPSISGISEANAAFQEFSKKHGWQSYDPQGTCKIRTDSLAEGKSTIQQALESSSLREALSPSEQILGHSTLAQLYAFSGEMEDSIREWKAAYDMAETAQPASLPNLEESLGASYLHLSEMENGIYLNNTDLDIFPPLHPHASFEKTEDSKHAIEYFQKYLEQQPDDLEVRWLLNLAYMTLGQYPSGVPVKYRIPIEDFQSKQNIGRFVDVAPQAGLNILRAAGGVLVDDFDNDGLLDVVVSSVDMCDPVHYFHNNGNGTFTDRTKEAGLLNELGGLNMVEADYNNDGCMDFLILRGGWEFPQRMSLLRNNCNGTFTDVTDASGLGSTLVQSQTAAWADIDNDGYLDLFVGNENGPAKLFHNRGDGTFEEIGHAAGIDQIAFTKGVTAADYDGDGYMDFYVANQNGINFLYHNNGNLTFTDVGKQAGVQAPAYSFATWFFDYDNDGWPDILVDNFLPSVTESVKTYVGGPRNAETMRLYRNNHDGTFKDVTKQVGLDKVFMPMGANFGDVDNDGYLDVYLGMGAPSYTSMFPHVLLRNGAGKKFVDITQSSGTGELHKGHGIAFADLTRQGREDIVAVIGGAVPGDKHTMRVFESPTTRNNWLNVRLIGVKTNREALGAQIHVTVTDGNASPRSIYRTVGQNSSFGGNPVEQNIGLGPDAHNLTLDIWWPTSKTRQHFTGMAVNQFIQIKEFATEYTRRDLHPFDYPKPGPSATAPLPQ
ncbi:MAG: FG-GAP-like repeat-containing protein [Terracidiphilus sp.]